MTEREQFEAWIKRPPIEGDIQRFSADCRTYGLAGRYIETSIQVAWEEWCAARGIKPEDQP